VKESLKRWKQKLGEWYYI